MISCAAFVFVWLLYVPVAILFAYVAGWGQQLFTLGKQMFLDVGLFFIPALAMLGFLDGHGLLRFGKALLMAALGALGLVLGAALARASFPAYPSSGPHELIACSFVLPAVAAPWLAIRLPAPWSVSMRSQLVGVAVATVVAGCTVFAFGSVAELALPLRVNGISRTEDSDIQDFSNYSVRVAEVDVATVERYASALELPSVDYPSWVLDDLPEFKGRTPPGARAWFKDSRRREGSNERYPSGLSGCTEGVAWVHNELYYAHHCDWGI